MSPSRLTAVYKSTSDVDAPEKPSNSPSRPDDVILANLWTDREKGTPGDD